MYGNALVKRGLIAFDELKQSIRVIQFFANSAAAVLTIGSADSNAATILRPVIDRFFATYPAVVLLRVDTVPSPALSDPGLCVILI